MKEHKDMNEPRVMQNDLRRFLGAACAVIFMTLFTVPELLNPEFNVRLCGPVPVFWLA